MDKNTLSNYGWIVIAVLVLSVMIALATPFGEYIKAGVESTTAGLFDTSEKALNVVGMSAGDDDSGKSNEPAKVVGSTTFDDGSTATWNELKQMGYVSDTEIFDSAFFENYTITSFITSDNVTTINNYAFFDCPYLTNIRIPNTVTYIGERAFYGGWSLTDIEYAGTKAQWDNIVFGEDWNMMCGNITVTCTDGTITIPAP